MCVCLFSTVWSLCRMWVLEVEVWQRTVHWGVPTLWWNRELLRWERRETELLGLVVSIIAVQYWVAVLVNPIHPLALVWARRVPISLWELIWFNTRHCTLVHTFCSKLILLVGKELFIGCWSNWSWNACVILLPGLPLDTKPGVRVGVSLVTRLVSV